jgi:hypothetical protein
MTLTLSFSIGCRLPHRMPACTLQITAIYSPATTPVAGNFSQTPAKPHRPKLTAYAPPQLLPSPLWQKVPPNNRYERIFVCTPEHVMR